MKLHRRISSPTGIVHIPVHCWPCPSCAFGQVYNDVCPSLQCHMEEFHCPTNPVFPPFILLPTPGNSDLFRLPSFTQKYTFKFLLVFHGLMVHLFFMLNNIPLSGCTPSLFSHSLLKDISCLQVLTIMNTDVISTCVQVFVWTWISTEECDCWTVH